MLQCLEAVSGHIFCLLDQTCVQREERLGLTYSRKQNMRPGRGLIWLSLMPTCVTSPPPAQLLDSMRCSRIPPIKPHFCRSEHELDFCPLKAKGQSPAP